MSVTHFRFGVSAAKSRARWFSIAPAVERALLCQRRRCGMPCSPARASIAPPDADRSVRRDNADPPTFAGAEHAVALGMQGSDVSCQTLVVARSGTQRSLSPVVVATGRDPQAAT